MLGARLAQRIRDPRIALAIDSDGMGTVADLQLFGLAGIIRREACHRVGVGVGNQDPALQVERDVERSLHLAGAVDGLVVDGAAQDTRLGRIAFRQVDDLALA
ncbi:hypothetical protein MesoLjLc_09740 [Mesorhizobium sp. L-8-10]|nr:hypothetical protein MesoLjLc_09740 [Mesorhizobium sp. L-8-10]